MSAVESPFISVIIPTRNEEHYIAQCLQTVLEGSFPLDKLEILVVDGRSNDRTRQIVAELCQRYPIVRLLDNPAKVVPHAMNIGIRAARGELIVRLDAHARYGADYLAQLSLWMERLNADNVGGAWVTLPGGNSAQAQAVALILSNRFGVGEAGYRVGGGSQTPTQVDTVPFGCYRREMFDRIGLYDERFIRNQDDELNARLKQAGGRIYLIPEIRIDYIARDSLGKLARMLYQYGYFKPLIAIKLGRPATLRQLAPPAFTAAVVATPFVLWSHPVAGAVLAASLVVHTAANVLVSASLARRKGWSLFPCLLAGFLSAHLAYGLGYLRGLIDFGVFRRHRRGGLRDVSLSR
jgi:glycosyltransferase involved in cell wall biosynthesis